MKTFTLELCRGRFGEHPLFRIEAQEPTSLVFTLAGLDGSFHSWSLSRGDLAMLRGLLANMGEWERALIHAGRLRPMLEEMDRPAGMDPYFHNKPPSGPERT